MTDEEYEAIGREVRRALSYVSFLPDDRAVAWGRAAVEAVTKRLRTDVPSVEEIEKHFLKEREKMDSGYLWAYNDAARVAHAMMLELQRPACTAPIHGMSTNEIYTTLRNFDGSVSALTLIGTSNEIYRLAQPAPIADPDAEAKRLCWTHYSAVWPHSGYSIDNVWNTQTTDGKDGWRAVAAAKGGKDECQTTY